MYRLSNAWRLSKASWQVLSEDKRMIGIPILGAVGAMGAFAVVALPGMLLVADRDSSAGGLARWIFVALGALAASWFAALGQAAVVAGAADIMDGGAPSLRRALGTYRRCSIRLLEWAVLATAVALVLDLIERRFGIVGRIVPWLGRAAFGILSFLALPVIVFEDLGAAAAFKRSAELLKQTWGEQVAFGFGMGLLTFVLVAPMALVGVLGWSTGILPLQILGIAIAGAAIALILATFSALSAVFKTALYRYAVGAPVDHAFTDDDLVHAFKPAKGTRTTEFSPPPIVDPLVETVGPVASSNSATLAAMVEEITKHAKTAKATKSTKPSKTTRSTKTTKTPSGSKTTRSTKTPSGSKAAKSTKATTTTATTDDSTTATATNGSTRDSTATKSTGSTKAGKSSKAGKSAKAGKSSKAAKASKSTKSRKAARAGRVKASGGQEGGDAG